MRPNPVKQKLLSGEVSLGTFLMEFKSPGITRLAGSAGAEFLVIDMEHTGWSIETVRQLIGYAGQDGPIPFVRVPATEYHFVARVLDVGAMGIMMPMVNDAQQARDMVDFAKYPPRGRRGAAFGVAHDDYRGEDILETMRVSDSEQFLIAQIETASGLENVEEIAAVDGIDCLWIGHFDLTNSLGIPGQFDHPEFLAALKRTVAACEANGKVAGFLVGDVDDGCNKISQGFRAIAYGVDLWIYQQALRDGLTALRDS